MRAAAIRLALTAVVFAALPAIGAAQPAFTSPDAFTHWMSAYYQHPAPEQTAAAMEYFATSELYGHRSAIVPTSHFFAAILRKHEDRLAPVYQLAQNHSSQAVKHFALNTIWLVNTAAAQRLLAGAKTEWRLSEDDLRALERRITQKPTWPLEAPVSGPASLDILWAIWSATGDPKAVEKVIEALDFVDAAGDRAITGGAAQWSLSAQAAHHPLVLDILRKQAAVQPEKRKRILEEIITRAEAGRRS